MDTTSMAGQPRNINDQETALIQKTFNEDLLKSMRAVMLGLPLTPQDKSLVRATFSDEPTMALIKKRFYPTLDRETPIGQVQDAWLGVETMIFAAPRDTIEQAVKYKERALDMTAHALTLLQDPDKPQTSMEYRPALDADPLRIELLARNQFIRHIENQLLFLHLIAQQQPPKKPLPVPAAGGKSGINTNSAK